MKKSIQLAVLICTFLAITTGAVVHSMPVSAQLSAQDANPSREDYQSDFVGDDAEYQRILSELEERAASSIKDPRNYIGDDVPLDVITQHFLEDTEETGKNQEVTNVIAAAPEAGSVDSPSNQDSLEQLIDNESANNSASSDESPQDSDSNAEPSATAPGTDANTSANANVNTDTSMDIDHIPAITSDQEYEEVLARLREEALGHVSHPMNYANDESEIEKLAASIDQLDTKEIYQRWMRGLPIMAEPLEECPICKDEMEELDETRMDPCSHKFHRRCLDTWVELNNLRYRVTCPMCRTRGSY